MAAARRKYPENIPYAGPLLSRARAQAVLTAREHSSAHAPIFAVAT